MQAERGKLGYHHAWLRELDSEATVTFQSIDERHLEAMAEIGRLRSRAIGTSFAVTLGAALAIAIVTGFQILFGLISGIALGGLVSSLYVNAMKNQIIQDACAKAGITPKELEAEKYIIDQREG